MIWISKQINTLVNIFLIYANIWSDTKRVMVRISRCVFVYELLMNDIFY